MRGLELTRHYAQELAIPALRAALGDTAFARLALGSVGEGSERFGFDDSLSRDHDWGVSLAVWVPDEEGDLAQRVRNALANKLFQNGEVSVLGFVAACPPGRAGAMTVGEHYRRFTACPKGPCSLAEWRAIPEHALAACTNGEVFFDGPGDFTAIRRRLLQGYPRPVLLERLAEGMFEYSQAGQYNLVRAAARADEIGKRLAYARACEAACLLGHALDGRYCPYYKWMHASLGRGSLFSRAVAAALKRLAYLAGTLGAKDAERVQEEAYGIARLFVGELQSQGVVTGDSPFLLDHVDGVRAKARAAERDEMSQEQEQCRNKN